MGGKCMTNYNKYRDMSIAEIAKFMEDTINVTRKQNEQVQESEEKCMTNFEKFKKDLTVEQLAEMILTAYCEGACDFCAYKNHSCIDYCKHGIKKWLESEVE